MNHNQTPSTNLVGIAKFILCKFAPLSVASLFAATAFATPGIEENCPEVDYLYERFETKFKAPTQNYFLTESEKSDWKLKYEGTKNPSYKASSLYPTLALVSVQAEMMSDLLSEQHMKRVECIYKTGDTNMPPITLSLDASATLIMDTNGMINNKARYSSRAGVLGSSTKWNKKLTAQYARTCPLEDTSGNITGRIEDCTFTFATVDQPNGYWQDAIYRCTVYAKCLTYRKEMSAIESRLDKINSKTGRPGCTDLFCTEEIKDMNKVIQKVTDYLMSCFGGCVTDPWWTCWGETRWKIEWDVKQEADQSPNNPVLKRVAGTRKWEFQGSGEFD